MRMSFPSKPVHEVGLGRGSKCSNIQRVDRGVIIIAFGADHGSLKGLAQVGEELCLDEPQGFSVAILGVAERPPKTERPAPTERPNDYRKRVELAAPAEQVKNGRGQCPPPPA